MNAAPARVPLGRGTTWTSRLAFGAAAIGNLFTATSDEQAAAAIDAAWDHGIRSFDTAPHYGLGLSERRLGASLAGRPRGEYTVSTKVGRLLEPVPDPTGDDLANGFAVPATHRRAWDFSATGVRRSLEESLTRLGLDHVDTVYLHDPDDHADQALTEAYPALEQLRAEGMAKAVGVGMNQPGLPARFVRDTDVDVVLLAGCYTLLERSGLDELLPLAAQRSVSVIAAGVFHSGLLAAPGPGAMYAYRPATPHVLDRALRLQRVCERHGVPLRAAAARFPFGHPAVAAVLIGLRTPDEVTDAVEQYSRPIPHGLWQDLRAEGLLPADVPVPPGPPPAGGPRPRSNR
ncbi:aldo/keto reductase [Streptomyces sp. BE303]|uniref:aldo/keto reductase n=1 Tax=Streptomyces sp. BE303 TaxID=3002528 RepID=UPI002E7A9D99|nr:aldo/keto reductase [Streptomyces sp. BE303]MED7947365.1 aldo/keto reductase [Streptomyces sp. BE303]